MHRQIPAPGTPVWIRQRRWIVDRAHVDRSVLRLDVSHGTERLTFLAPFDRPVFAKRRVRSVRIRRQHALARCAAVLAQRHAFDMPLSARDARVDLLPHQLEPALAVLHGTRRILIADDVGLGKTIQAGFILAELLRRQPAARALVVVPATLVDQWHEELRTRFGVTLRIANAETLAYEVRQAAFGAVPWDRHGVWLSSADFLKQRHIADSLPLTPWDLVVFDEAHTVAGPSDRHLACHDLAQRARHVVLLSATPHAGDDQRFARLHSLGRLPDAGPVDNLVTFQRSQADMGLPHTRHVRWKMVRPSADVARVYDALAAFERAVLHAARGSHDHPALLLLAVFRKRATSTLRALDETLSRRLEWLDAPQHADNVDWLQPRLSFDGDDEHDADEQAVLMADIGMPTRLERAWLKRLRVLTTAALPGDPKVIHVRSLLARTREPVVIFTEFRHSLDHLRGALQATTTIAVLHGSQTPAERRAALQRFLVGDARALIATDVAGQGLNLQHRARWVINLELPWNPTRIAQRIGRVDRIGQRGRVHATVLVADHPVEAPVLATLARRMLRARHALGTGTLADVLLPDHFAIAEAVISARPIASSAGPTPVVVCRDWHRRARVMARALVDRRRWQRAWLGPERPGRPLVTASALTIAARPTVPSPVPIAIVLVSFADATGLIVERHALAATVASAASRGLSHPLLHALERTAAACLAARHRRVERAQAVVVARLAAIEHAIGAHLRDLRCPEETQLGLFSNRAARNFSTAGADADDRARAQRVELSRLDRRGRIAIDRPTLAVLFEARR